MAELTDERLLSMAAEALGYASIDLERGAEEGPGSFRQALEVFPEELIAFARATLAAQPPAPASAADGERDHVPGAGNMVPAAYAARLRQCPAHGQLPANAWACPECLRELREELARLRGLAADGEQEELAQWLERIGDDYDDLYRSPSALIRPKLARAAALLRQLPPEGLVAVEYFHIASSARIVGEASEKWGECWNVYNSRHVSPCTEFRTVADAVAALRQPPKGGEVES